MKAFLALLKRDLLLAYRNRGELATRCCFLLLWLVCFRWR